LGVVRKDNALDFHGEPRDAREFGNRESKSSIAVSMGLLSSGFVKNLEAHTRCIARTPKGVISTEKGIVQ